MLVKGKGGGKCQVKEKPGRPRPTGLRPYESGMSLGGHEFQRCGSGCEADTQRRKMVGEPRRLARL